MKILVGLLVIAAITISCSKKKKEAPKAEPQAATDTSTPAKTLLIMSYNLHNLFDPVHTVEKTKVEFKNKETGKIESKEVEWHKNDYSYLPKAECEAAKKKGIQGIRTCYDWTEEKFAAKLLQKKKVFDLRKEVFKEEKYPDILAVSEIENANVARHLAKTLGYPNFQISQSRDNRGIDLAVFYHESKDLKYVRHEQHDLLENEVTCKKKGRNGIFEAACEGKKSGTVTEKTRPIFEVQFEVGGKPLFFFVNHWPSQSPSHPPIQRTNAARRLRHVMELRQANVKGAHFIATGDFNTKEIERPSPAEHPFHDVLLGQGIKNVPPHISDVNDEVMRKGMPVFPGTYNYDDKWQHLDRFFVSENLLDRTGMDVDLQSFHIFAHEKLMEKCRRGKDYCLKDDFLKPNGYNYRANPKNVDELGYSDHLAIYLKVIVR